MPTSPREPTPPGVAALAVGAVLLGLSRPAPASPGPPAEPVVAVRAGGAWLAGTVPPFWEEERDRLQLEAEAWWRPSEVVALGATVDAVRSDRYADGQRLTGAGDLRLHTDLRLWQGPVDGRLRWQVKLPNADDEVQLGTDETDVHVGLGLVAAPGPARLDLAGGVAVLGDPRRATAQAWRPEASLGATLAAGPVAPRARLQALVGNSRLPTQATLGLGIEGRCPWLLGAEGLVGLSPAAPDLGARAWLGWGFGCDAAPSPGG